LKTVVGLFDNWDQAKKAALDVEAAGIPHNDISIVANNEGGKYVPTDGTAKPETTTTGNAIGQDALVGAGIGGVAGLIVGLTGAAIPGLGWIAGAGWLMSLIVGAGAGAVIGGLIGALSSVGVPEEEASYYAEGVRRGGVLLAVKAQDDLAHRVAQILGDDGAVNIDERAEQYRQEGFRPATSTPMAATNTMNTSTQQTAPASQNLNRQGETVVPVVEEKLNVDKREVPKGGVRVYTHVTQQPVQEQVTLREEHVNVDRRPVDRPVNQADAAAFKEQSFEIPERSEEAVVNKQARVVEEVVVNKQATERNQTVQDTVRRTDVDVQPLSGSEHTSRTRRFEAFNSDFRNDYQTRYANQGGTYEQYEPVYRYGYDLASQPNYQGRSWTEIEPQIRQDWERRQPNTWDRFKDSVRFGWDRATGAARGGIQTGGRDYDGTPDTRGMAEKAADAVTGDRIDDKTGRPV